MPDRFTTMTHLGAALALLAALLFAGAGASAQSEEETAVPATAEGEALPAGPIERVEDERVQLALDVVVEQLAERLTLSAEQGQAVRPIYEQHFENLLVLRDKYAGSDGRGLRTLRAARGDMRQAQDAHTTRMAEVLTTTQMVAFEEMRDAMREKMRARMMERWRAGGGVSGEQLFDLEAWLEAAPAARGANPPADTGE